MAMTNEELVLAALNQTDVYFKNSDTAYRLNIEINSWGLKVWLKGQTFALTNPQEKLSLTVPRKQLTKELAKKLLHTETRVWSDFYQAWGTLQGVVQYTSAGGHQGTLNYLLHLESGHDRWCDANDVFMTESQR